MPKDYKIRAITKYNKTNTKSYAFRFNKRTQADIIAQLDCQSSKAGYIARLIREDMARQGINFEPLTLGKIARDEIKDEDEVIIIFPDNSRLKATRDSILNDNRFVDHYQTEEHIGNRLFIINVRYS